MQVYQHKDSFTLECGAVLPSFELAYHTYGTLAKNRDNVIWICHALTGNSDAADWWTGLVGAGKLFDPQRYFIVCANMLGSCYGSTGAASINPETSKPYGDDFPLVTVRDMARTLHLLREHLGISHIRLAIGGSMGGQQVLEMASMQAGVFDQLCVLATNAQHSPWGIAFNEAQRMAIKAGLMAGSQEAAWQGLEAARAIAMISYRNYETYLYTQSENILDVIDDFRAASYQRYQGEKLRKRFDIHAYVTLSKAMDSHNLGRGRGSVQAALRKIKIPTLVIGISSDLLFPVEEQRFISRHMPQAQLEIITSGYGHDGFLIEFNTISKLLDRFLSQGVKKAQPKRKKQLNTAKTKAFPGTEGF